jgi:hypothetical protein
MLWTYPFVNYFTIWQYILDGVINDTLYAGLAVILEYKEVDDAVYHLSTLIKDRVITS